MKYDVIVIGGGASGVVTALRCAEYGLNCLIIEAGDRLLKKVLATGNGRCNYTNRDVDNSRYNTPFVKNAIAEFGYKDAIDYFCTLGMKSIEEDGRIYPYSRQASTVVNILMRELERSGITVVTGEKVRSVSAGFTVNTDKSTYRADNVVIATGSNATSGYASYDILKSLQHNYTLCMPSLTYLRCDKSYVKGLAGIRIKASASMDIKGGKLTRSGELLFKEAGVSGIMIFELSSFFARHMNTSEFITIDMTPDIEYNDLKEFLDKDGYSLLDRLYGLLPKALAVLVNSLAGGDRDKAAELIKGYKIRIDGLGDIKNAQVVSGGLVTSEFDSVTMMSKKAEGLYAVGEVLDVDGECGGYNLHWAWASAMAAARSIGERYGKK